MNVEKITLVLRRIFNINTEFELVNTKNYQGGISLNRKQKTASIVLAMSLVVGVPFSASAKKAPAPVKVEYVALGDSLAAGLSPNGYLDYGYVDYIADSFVAKKYKLADFDNFSVPGYTSDRLLLDVTKSKKIRKEIKSATHITIDIGANDLLAKINTDPSKASEALVAVSTNLNKILKTIDGLNPKVKVYVMGYYNCFPYYPAEQQAALMPLLTGLNTQIKSAAAENGDTFVATDKAIAKNYKKYLPNKTNIHLSDSGYKVLAAEFWKAINKKK